MNAHPPSSPNHHLQTIAEREQKLAEATRLRTAAMQRLRSVKKRMKKNSPAAEADASVRSAHDCCIAPRYRNGRCARQVSGSTTTATATATATAIGTEYQI